MSRMMLRPGMEYIACHVIGCDVTQKEGVTMRVEDVATDSNICLSLAPGGAAADRP
jgi:hypothetical protein